MDRLKIPRRPAVINTATVANLMSQAGVDNAKQILKAIYTVPSVIGYTPLTRNIFAARERNLSSQIQFRTYQDLRHIDTSASYRIFKDGEIVFLDEVSGQKKDLALEDLKRYLDANSFPHAGDGVIETIGVEEDVSVAPVDFSFAEASSAFSMSFDGPIRSDAFLKLGMAIKSTSSTEFNFTITSDGEELYNTSIIVESTSNKWSLNKHYFSLSRRVRYGESIVINVTSLSGDGLVSDCILANQEPDLFSSFYFCPTGEWFCDVNEGAAILESGLPCVFEEEVVLSGDFANAAIHVFVDTIVDYSMDRAVRAGRGLPGTKRVTQSERGVVRASSVFEEEPGKLRISGVQS